MGVERYRIRVTPPPLGLGLREDAPCPLEPEPIRLRHRRRPIPGAELLKRGSSPTSSSALAAAAPAASSPSSFAPPPPNPFSRTCGSPPGRRTSPRLPPRPSSASGECRPRFETRPGLTTGARVLYPLGGEHARGDLRTDSRGPVPVERRGPLLGLRRENPRCSSLDLPVEPIVATQRNGPPGPSTWSSCPTSPGSRAVRAVTERPFAVCCAAGMDARVQARLSTWTFRRSSPRAGCSTVSAHGRPFANHRPRDDRGVDRASSGEASR